MPESIGGLLKEQAGKRGCDGVIFEYIRSDANISYYY